MNSPGAFMKVENNVNGDREACSDFIHGETMRRDVRSLARPLLARPSPLRGELLEHLRFAGRWQQKAGNTAALAQQKL